MLFITSLVIITGCDIRELKGDLKIICKGETIDTYYYPKDISNPMVNRELKTIIYTFENKKNNELMLTCHNWTESKIYCSDDIDSPKIFLNLNRETGEIIYQSLSVNNIYKDRFSFKGLCEKFKENKL